MSEGRPGGPRGSLRMPEVGRSRRVCGSHLGLSSTPVGHYSVTHGNLRVGDIGDETKSSLPPSSDDGRSDTHVPYTPFGDKEGELKRDLDFGTNFFS